MLDRYNNFYKERSASRDKGKENVNQNKQPKKRDIDMIGLPAKPVVQKNVEESLGLRDPVQMLEKDVGEQKDSGLNNPGFIK